jgi:hypothetical protein
VIPPRLREPASEGLLRLRRLHSGQAGDYVAWLSFGAAAFGVLLAAVAR